MGFEIGKTVAGYEIVEVLGTSKTGVAYKVRNVFAQRFEVLKLLPKSIQDDEEQNARFLREIKVHAQLLHPNIVTFYNAREIEGQLVMTKEFVPGAELAEKLKPGPIAWCEANRYACHVLSGLEYAHAHGIVHRGLSSSNIIITEDGIARLNGFGFAKSLSDPELTAAGVVLGALKYMSPEQVKGERIDLRSDIYSLGIVFYEMLVGKLPFDAKSQFEIMMAQVSAPPKHVSDVNPEVPRELGDLVAKALAKPASARFQTAKEFREAVEGVILSHDATVVESKVPPAFEAETPKPAADPVPLAEPPTPASPAPLADAWALESALSLAESKLAPMELKSTRPAEESPAFVESPARVPSLALTDPAAVDYQPESEPTPRAVETAEQHKTPAALFPALDWWSSDSRPALVESRSDQTVLEVAPPIEDAGAVNDASNQIPATSLPDALAIESVIASAEPAPRIEPQTPVLDWWALNSQLTARSTPSQAESVLLPEKTEPAAPVNTTLSIADSPVEASPSLLSDLWTMDWRPSPTESNAEPVQPDLLTAAHLSEAPPAPEIQAPSALSSHPDLWAAQPLLNTSEAKSPAINLSHSLLMPETPVHEQQEHPAEETLSLWTSGPPHTWVPEPAAEPPLMQQTNDEPVLSSAIEPPQVAAESAPPAESPTTSSALTEQPLAVDSQPASVEPAPQLAPELAAPPTVPAASAPVAPRPAYVNPDLLTALFGDTLLSRVSLTLVVCAITFLLGTVALYAVLSVTKP